MDSLVTYIQYVQPGELLAILTTGSHNVQPGDWYIWCAVCLLIYIYNTVWWRIKMMYSLGTDLYGVQSGYWYIKCTVMWLNYIMCYALVTDLPNVHSGDWFTLYAVWILLIYNMYRYVTDTIYNVVWWLFCTPLWLTYLMLSHWLFCKAGKACLINTCKCGDVSMLVIS